MSGGATGDFFSEVQHLISLRGETGCVNSCSEAQYKAVTERNCPISCSLRGAGDVLPV